jgi:hypothetical protein
MGNDECRDSRTSWTSKVRVVPSPARMPAERTTPEPVSLPDTPGATEWLALTDELLAGLVHALNNRITAMSVCVELAGLGDDQMLKDGMLAQEVGRLQRTGALLGLLPARGQPEALEMAPVLDDVLAIHAHHPRTRDVDCTVDVRGTPPPVRVPRWALLRLLLVLVNEAKATAQVAEQRSVTLTLSGDARELRLQTRTRGSVNGYAAAMATLCGGTLQSDGVDAVLTLPGLAEVRLRERAARTSG